MLPTEDKVRGPTESHSYHILTNIATYCSLTHFRTNKEPPTLTTFSPPSPLSSSRPTWGECEMANREDGHIPSSDPRDSVVFQQVSYLHNHSHLMLGSRSVFDYRTDAKKPRSQIWWWWKTMRISHTRQPSRPTPPSAKERLSALGNVGNRRGNVNSDCEKVRGTFQGNMIFGRWENLPSLFPSHPMSAYFLVNSTLFLLGSGGVWCFLFRQCWSKWWLWKFSWLCWCW